MAILSLSIFNAFRIPFLIQANISHYPSLLTLPMQLKCLPDFLLRIPRLQHWVRIHDGGGVFSSGKPDGGGAFCTCIQDGGGAFSTPES